MNKLISAALVATICTFGLPAAAQNKAGTPEDAKTSRSATDAAAKPGMAGAGAGNSRMGMRKDMMKAMDTNADGMISQDEYMKHHAAMWDKMPKGTNGLVSAKVMETSRH